MKIVGPERYALTYSPNEFSVICENGGSGFSTIAKSPMPKLYVVSYEGKPVYFGITKQGMKQRLYFGWRASGSQGYYGYRWRNSGSSAELHVWGHSDAIDRNVRDIETAEAEVVFLFRRITGQWPAYQTEIHFYPSTDEHRRVASEILSHYGLCQS